MSDNSNAKYHFGLVGRVKVEGNSCKEFTLNYLKELVKQYEKEYPNVKERYTKYIEYFVDNFTYDKKMRDERLKDVKSKETQERNEEDLSNMFEQGKGVCQQFSQGFALLCYLDKELKGKINLYYTVCQIAVNNKEMGHAINLVITEDNKCKILDISSMIHAKEKDYVGNIWDYGNVVIDDYIKNQKQNKFKFVPNSKDSSDTYLISYINAIKDIDTYYDFLNLPSDVLQEGINNGETTKLLYRINIDQEMLEEPLTNN